MNFYKFIIMHIGLREFEMKSNNYQLSIDVDPISFFYSMKKIILLIWFSPILSNSNFEILNLPQNIYAFTVNEYSFNDNLNDNIYSLSFSKYPANISLLNFSYNKKFIFSFLDYGILNNQIDNDILNSFSSYEVF